MLLWVMGVGFGILANKVQNSSNSFTSFLNQIQNIMEKNLLSINELKEAFFSLKTNKSPGYKF